MQSRYFILFIITWLCLAQRNAWGQLLVRHVVVSGEMLPYTGQHLQFAALSNDLSFVFSKSDKVGLYRYKLNGFDKKWVYSPYPVARYTNLTGGNYTLHIQGIAGKKIVGHERLSFEVERELTEEWWFFPTAVLYVLVLLGALMYFFILYDFKQKLKVQAIRNRIAADLHDEIGATLSSIALATIMVQRKVGSESEHVRTLLSNIKSDSEQTIHTIRDTVWAINPDNDSLEKLIEKMRSIAFQMLAAQHISLRFETQVKTATTIRISMERRRDLYLIYKEAINNIVKHSQATNVKVLISNGKEGLHWLIEDNGIGFVTSVPAEGNGLRNFHQRAKESFIDLTITSAIGIGTSIEMVVPEL